LIDHILEHLDLADVYQANATRVAVLKSGSKRLCDVGRRFSEAAEREHAEAAAHVRDFGIDPLTRRQERAMWRRLRQYALDRVEALTLADLRWLRAMSRHGRPGSRNVRRASELLFLAEAFLSDGQVDEYK